MSFNEAPRTALLKGGFDTFANVLVAQMLNIGMSIVQDVDDNLSILNGDLKLTDADQGLLADYSRVAYISDYFKTLRMV